MQRNEISLIGYRLSLHSNWYSINPAQSLAYRRRRGNPYAHGRACGDWGERTEEHGHVVINNCAHETVGGMPTVADRIDIPAIARACGYPSAVSVDSHAALDTALAEAKEQGQADHDRGEMRNRCARGFGQTDHHGSREQAEFHGVFGPVIRLYWLVI